MEQSKKEIDIKERPFAFGIKEFKRVLNQAGMSKSDKNKILKIYKERVYTRVAEVKSKMKEIKEKGLNAVLASSAIDKEKSRAANK